MSAASITKASAVEEKAAYAPYFDVQKGFKPAQPNLTAIFLQLAGSLEANGSPEPYIRHVMAEHARIAAKYTAATGKTDPTLPSYLTDTYVENLIAGWKKLEGPLKLDDLCRESGRNMRYAIMGGWNKSPAELLSQEVNLSEAQRQTYAALLSKPYFDKGDFPAMEAFYKGPFEKLTEEGKAQTSKRTARGQLAPNERTKAIEADRGGTSLIALFNHHQDLFVVGKANVDSLQNSLTQQLNLNDSASSPKTADPFKLDPLRYSALIKAGFQLRIEHARSHSTSPGQAENVEKLLVSMSEDLMVIAHSELIAAAREMSLQSQPSVKGR